MADSPNGPEQYECPVCLETLIPPIYQCYNGHLICRTCLPTLQKCPICREKLPETKIRNLEIEKIVKRQKLPCPNRRLGCTATLMCDLIEAHRVNCFFSCRNFCAFLGIASCSEETTLVDFVDHLMRRHKMVGEFVQEGSSVEICQSGAIPGNIQGGKVGWLPNFIVLEGDTFFLRTNVATYGISWMISALGDTEAANNFTASIKLVPQGDDQATTFIWQGQVCSLESKFEDNPNIFSLSFPQLRLLWKKEAQNDQVSLKLKVRIAKKGHQILHNRGTTVINSVAYNQPISFVEAQASDSEGAAGLIVHAGVACDGCETGPLIGPRYKCIECPDFDLCKDCVDTNIHSHHLFIRASGSNMRKKLAKVHQGWAEASAPGFANEEESTSGEE